MLCKLPDWGHTSSWQKCVIDGVIYKDWFSAKSWPLNKELEVTYLITDSVASHKVKTRENIQQTGLQKQHTLLFSK